MKPFARRAAAFLLAAVMAVSLAACQLPIKWIARTDEEEYPVGLYLLALMDSAGEASTLVEHPEGNVYAQEIDGVMVPDWIDQRAQDEMRQLAAIRSKFREMGLSFTEEEQSFMDQSFAIQWMYYGQSLQNSGVAEESFRLSVETEEMRQKLFDTIYGEGGEKEIPEADLRAVYDENYVKVSYMQFSLTTMNEEGESVADEEAKAAADEFLAKVRDQGVDFYEAISDYEASIATEDNPAETHEGGEHDAYLDVRSAADAGLTEETATELKNAAVGDIVVYETEDVMMVFQKLDHVADEEGFQQYVPTIMEELKGDEFQETVESWASEIGLEFNESRLKDYTAEELFVGN